MKQDVYWRPKDIRRPRIKYSRHGELAPDICAALNKIIWYNLVEKVLTVTYTEKHDDCNGLFENPI